MNKWSVKMQNVGNIAVKIPLLSIGLGIGLIRATNASGTYLFDIISTLNSIQSILVHVGPTLSAVLFVVAGIFYAIGQLFPSQKRATLHSASIDIIIGAIIVAVLSVASTGLALASTGLLTNVTANVL